VSGREALAGPLDRALAWVALVMTGLSLVPSLVIGATVIRHRDGWSTVTYVDVPPTLFGTAVLLTTFAIVALLLVRYVRRWRGGESLAGADALALAGLTAAALHDVVDGVWGHRGMHLMPVGLLWMIGCVGVALVGRFVQGARCLQELSGKLERAMAERNAELATARADLVETRQLATLGRLAAAVAHEINNPVAVVAANLGYLRDAISALAPTPGEELEAIQDTLASVDRIAGIVRQLVEAGELASYGGTVFPVELASTIRTAVTLARGRIKDPPPVTFDVEPNLYVSSQEASLRQVLASLVVAAMEAMQAYEAPGTVRVSVHKQRDRIVVRVEDDAPEQDDVLRERRFKPYLDTRPEIVRSDVGLSVSLALIRMLGADLELERSSDRGSVVSIDLRAAEPPAVRSDAPASSRSQRARILIVDDDVLTRIGLRRLLGREYVVDEAGTVEKALQLIRSDGDELDIVLCDVVMPDGGAETLVAALSREAPRLAGAVLMLTGGAVDQATSAFLANHADRTVRKPVDISTLRAMIERTRVRRSSLQSRTSGT
jgi:signal transduction histidine kinase/ActR/RegA family two-component response regulator